MYNLFVMQERNSLQDLSNDDRSLNVIQAARLVMKDIRQKISCWNQLLEDICRAFIVEDPFDGSDVGLFLISIINSRVVALLAYMLQLFKKFDLGNMVAQPLGCTRSR